MILSNVVIHNLNLLNKLKCPKYTDLDETVEHIKFWILYWEGITGYMKNSRQIVQMTKHSTWNNTAVFFFIVNCSILYYTAMHTTVLCSINYSNWQTVVNILVHFNIFYGKTKEI